MASFVVGAFTSMAAGYVGMMVAVFANARTTVSALEDGAKGWTACFNCAFRSGAIMGFSNCGIAITVLYGLCQIYRDVFTDLVGPDDKRYIDYTLLFECVSGFGLGASSIALFGRVGGGIFTKAADVGADLSGKVIGLGDGKMLDEDSPYNPAVIADNVGDNVGDVGVFRCLLRSVLVSSEQVPCVYQYSSRALCCFQLAWGPTCSARSERRPALRCCSARPSRPSATPGESTYFASQTS
eukprot:3933244-Rhodomonas_salina.3